MDKATGTDSVLTTLKNRAGDSLNIASTDKYQISWVQNGKISTTSGEVGSKALSDLLNIKDQTSSEQVAGIQKVKSDGVIQVLGEKAFFSSPLPATLTSTHASNPSGSGVNAESAYTYTYAGTYTADSTPSKDDIGTKTWTATLKSTAASSGSTTSTNLTSWDYGAQPADGKDKFNKLVYTPDKTAGLAVSAATAGVEGQLSGLTISILDQDGNVKKAANAALDQFKQYQRAENMTGDMSLNFHIGSEANVAIKVGLSDMRSQALGLKGSDGTRIDVYTKEHANAAINVIENAITKALDQQTTIGAVEARLEYTSTNLTTSSENVQAAESTIRDADMAKEMTNYTKSNVLLQAAQAMLAQANQNSSAVLSLLQ